MMMMIAITVQRCSFGLHSNSSEPLYNHASKRRIWFGASLDCDGDHSLIASPAERTSAEFNIDLFCTTTGFCTGPSLWPVSLIDIGRWLFCLLIAWFGCLLIDWLINHCILFFCLQYWSDRMFWWIINRVTIWLLLAYAVGPWILSNSWVRRFLVVYILVTLARLNR